jgi:hypothetical protein
MVHERFDRIPAAGGQTVHARFDLSDEQLFALAHAAEGMIAEHYRGVSLTADEVLEMRELVALHDNALERGQDGYAGGTLMLTVSRLGLAVRALSGWLARCERLGLIHAQDAFHAAVAEALLEDLTDLHARAVRIAVAADFPAYLVG